MPGEALAARYLEGRKLVVLVKNFRCIAEEIDLVRLAADTLDIVLVRQRSSTEFGGALASVGAAKQRLILRTTQYYLLRHAQWRHTLIRFGVIALYGAASGVQQIEWIRDAFRAT
jgi:putative endonuclease